jgi:hypothetical protein
MAKILISTGESGSYCRSAGYPDLVRSHPTAYAPDCISVTLHIDFFPDHILFREDVVQSSDQPAHQHR